jgi:hypothetical protein
MTTKDKFKDFGLLNLRVGIDGIVLIHGLGKIYGDRALGKAGRSNG